MIYRLSFGIMVVLCAGIGGLNAENFTCGNFDLHRDKTLRLGYGGVPLIERDTLDYAEGFDKAEELICREEKGRYLLNVTKEKSNVVQYRKEVALGKNGLELTVKYKLFPYKNNPDEPLIRYSFFVPYETLKDAAYKAYVGRARGPSVVEGKAGNSLSGIRYIAFASDSLRLLFDFNPMGVCSSGDYCSWGEPVGCWSMERDGDYIVFSFGYSAKFYGGVFMSKCLICEGEYDYDARHAYPTWGYRGGTTPAKQFSFGTTQPPKGFQRADDNLYTSEKGHGWEKEGNLAVRRTKDAGVINNCLCCPDGAENTFIVDITPGYYVMTLRIRNNGGDTGPFDVFVNGEKCATDVSVGKGEARTVTFAKHLKDAQQAKITFKGKTNWAISSIAVQPLIYQTEDYAFDRGLWNVSGIFTPK